jgi:hypothetical protein
VIDDLIRRIWFKPGERQVRGAIIHIGEAEVTVGLVPRQHDLVMALHWFKDGRRHTLSLRAGDPDVEDARALVSLLPLPEDPGRYRT